MAISELDKWRQQHAQNMRYKSLDNIYDNYAQTTPAEDYGQTPEYNDTVGNGVVGHAIDAAQAGIANNLGGMMRFVGSEWSPFGGEWLESGADYMNEIARRNTPTEELTGANWWANAVGNAIGSSIPTMAAGAALTAATGGLGGIGAVGGLFANVATKVPMAGRVVGAAKTMWSTPYGKMLMSEIGGSPAEAISEAGNLIDDMRAKGYTDEEISAAAHKSAAMNAGWLLVSNILEAGTYGKFGEKIASKALRGTLKDKALAYGKSAAFNGATNALSEGVQEYGQNAIGNLAEGVPFEHEEALEAMKQGAAGGLFLGGLGGAYSLHTNNQIRDNAQDYLKAQSILSQDEGVKKQLQNIDYDNIDFEELLELAKANGYGQPQARVDATEAGNTEQELGSDINTGIDINGKYVENEASQAWDYLEEYYKTTGSQKAKEAIEALGKTPDAEAVLNLATQLGWNNQAEAQGEVQAEPTQQPAPMSQVQEQLQVPAPTPIAQPVPQPQVQATPQQKVQSATDNANQSINNIVNGETAQMEQPALELQAEPKQYPSYARKNGKSINFNGDAALAKNEQAIAESKKSFSDLIEKVRQKRESGKAFKNTLEKVRQQRDAQKQADLDAMWYSAEHEKNTGNKLNTAPTQGETKFKEPSSKARDFMLQRKADQLQAENERAERLLASDFAKEPFIPKPYYGDKELYVKAREKQVEKQEAKQASGKAFKKVLNKVRQRRAEEKIQAHRNTGYAAIDGTDKKATAVRLIHNLREKANKDVANGSIDGTEVEPMFFDFKKRIEDKFGKLTAKQAKSIDITLPTNKTVKAEQGEAQPIATQQEKPQEQTDRQQRLEREQGEELPVRVEQYRSDGYSIIDDTDNMATTLRLLHELREKVDAAVQLGVIDGADAHDMLLDLTRKLKNKFGNVPTKQEKKITPTKASNQAIAKQGDKQNGKKNTPSTKNQNQNSESKPIATSEENIVNGKEEGSEVKVTGDEFASYKDLDELREKAFNYYRENLQGTSVESSVLGNINFSDNNVDFTKRGIKKVISSSYVAEKLLLIPHLPALIRTAIKAKSESNNKDKRTAQSYTYLENKAIIKGKKEKVIISIFTDVNGNKFYNHNIIGSEESNKKEDISVHPAQANNDVDGIPAIDKSSTQSVAQTHPKGNAKAESVTEKSKVKKDVIGNEATVITDDRTEFKVRYKLLEANSLVTSNSPIDGSKNTAYPQELQPRNREKTAMMLQVETMANNLNPADLADSRNINQGAPIVNSSNVVENGNGRSMALIKVLSEERRADVAGKYKNYLRENASKFGFNASDLDKLQRPILVRERMEDVPIDSVTGSTAGGAAMSATEQAKEDAKRVTVATLNRCSTNDDGNINLMSGDNHGFIISFIDDVTKGDAGKINQLMTNKGKPNQEAFRRVKNALFHLAYGDEETLALLSESTDANIKTLVTALTNAAPSVAKLKRLIEDGNAFDVNFTEPILDACKKISEIRNAGKTSKMYGLNSLFDNGNEGGSIDEQIEDMSDLSDEAKAVLKFLMTGTNARSTKRVNGLISSCYQRVYNLGDPNQQTLFGEEPIIPTPMEVIQNAIAEVNEATDEAKAKSNNTSLLGGTLNFEVKENEEIYNKAGSSKDIRQGQEESSRFSEKSKDDERSEPDTAEETQSKVGGQSKAKKASQASPKSQAIAKIKEMAWPFVVENKHFEPQEVMEALAEYDAAVEKVDAEFGLSDEDITKYIRPSRNKIAKHLGDPKEVKKEAVTELKKIAKPFGGKNNTSTIEEAEKALEEFYSVLNKAIEKMQFLGETDFSKSTYTRDINPALNKIKNRIAILKKEEQQKAGSAAENFFTKEDREKMHDIKGRLVILKKQIEKQAKELEHLVKTAKACFDEKFQLIPEKYKEWKSQLDESSKIYKEYDTVPRNYINLRRKIAEKEMESYLDVRNNALNAMLSIDAGNPKIKNAIISQAKSTEKERGDGHLSKTAREYLLNSLTPKQRNLLEEMEFEEIEEAAVAEYSDDDTSSFEKGELELYLDDMFWDNETKEAVRDYGKKASDVYFAGDAKRSDDAEEQDDLISKVLDARNEFGYYYRFEFFKSVDEDGLDRNERAEFNSLQNKKDELQKQLENGEITDEEYSAKVKANQERIDALLKTKYLARDNETVKRSINEVKTEIKSVFPNATFDETPNGFVANLPNEKRVLFNILDKIVINQSEAKRARKAHDIKGDISIHGSWVKLSESDIDGIIDISLEGGKGTAYHEAMHAAIDLALTEKEKQALSDYAKKHKSDNKATKNMDDEEFIAEMYRAWVLDRKNNGMFGKLWNKVKDFFYAMKAFFTGAENIHNIMANVESGKVFERDNLDSTVEQTAKGTGRVHYQATHARRTLKEVTRKFSKLIDDYLNGNLKKYWFEVMKTPLSMQIVGADDLPVVISKRFLEKALKEKHKEEIGRKLLLQIPKRITDPMMILKAYKQDGSIDSSSFIVVLDLIDSKGATIMVPVAFNSVPSHTQYVANILESVYPRRKGGKKDKPNDKWYLDRIKDSELLYINKKRTTHWITQRGLNPAAYGLPASTETGSTTTMLSNSFNLSNTISNETDLVKLRKQNLTKYSAVPAIRKTSEKPAGFDNFNPYQKMNETVKKTEVPSMSKKVADSIEQMKDFYVKFVDKFDKLSIFDDAISQTLGNAIPEYSTLKNKTQTVTNRVSGGVHAFVEGNEKELKQMQERYGVRHAVSLKMVLQDLAKNKDKLLAFAKEKGVDTSRGEQATLNDLLDSYLTANTMLETARDNKRAYEEEYAKWVKNGKKGDEPVFTEYKFPNDMSEKEVASIVSDAPQELKNTAKMYYQFNKNLLDILKHGGLISQSTYNALDEKTAYCPLIRDFSENNALEEYLEKLSTMSKGGKNIVNVVSPLKKRGLAGSDRNILSPLEQTINSLGAILGRTERNLAAQHALKMQTEASKVNPNAPKMIWRVFGSQADPKNNIFTVMVGGRKQSWQTVDELYPTLNYSFDNGFKIDMPILVSAGKILRAGATLSPMFTVKNFLRDTIFAGVTSQNGFIPFWSSVKGAYKLATDKDFRAEYEASGVTSSGYYGAEEARKALDELGKNPFVPKTVKDFVKMPYKVLEAMSSFSEDSTRAGEFYLARRNKKNIDEATYNAIEATLNFNRNGTIGKEWNRITPFFNACIQGSDKLYRLFKKNPTETMFRIGKYIILPSVFLWAMNHDKDWWNELDPNVKRTNWILDLGDTQIVIPKPQEAGILFGTGIEAMLEYAYNDNPKEMDEWAKEFVKTIVPSIMPSIFVPFVEWTANYSFFRDKPIVNTAKQKLPNGMQYGDYTSEISKAVGGALNVSPLKLDNAWFSMTGTLGRFALQAPDNLVADKRNLPAKKTDELAFIRDFVVNDTKKTRTMNDFYELKTLADQQHAAYGKKGKPTPQVASVNTAFRLISKKQMEIRDVTSDKRLGPEQKRSKIDKLKAEQNRIARKCIDTYGKHFGL